MAQLPLTRDALDRGLLPWKSRLWCLLHRQSKPVIRWAIHMIYSKYYHEIYAHKLTNGWLNQEIVLLHDELEFMFVKEYEHDKTKRNDDGTWNLKHKDMKTFYELRAIICVMLDEDTFYLLRFLFMAMMIHEDWDEYKKRMFITAAYWDKYKIIKEIQQGVYDDNYDRLSLRRPVPDDDVKRIQDEDRGIPPGNPGSPDSVGNPHA